jgi:hypothetical protein
MADADGDPWIALVVGSATVADCRELEAPQPTTTMSAAIAAASGFDENRSVIGMSLT